MKKGRGRKAQHTNPKLKPKHIFKKLHTNACKRQVVQGGKIMDENKQKTVNPTGSRYRPYYSYAHELNNETDTPTRTPSAPEKPAETAALPETVAAVRPNAAVPAAPQKKKRRTGTVIVGLILLAVLGFACIGLFAGSTSPEIAVINIYGDMQTGELPYGSGYAGSDTVCRLIRQAVDDGCAAIVLRINSGGGSGSAAEEIVMEIRRAQELGVPVVASIGDSGASAAYWVAAQCDYIYVTNSTLTGSIGSIGIHTDTSRALESEGIDVEIFKSGAFKDMFYSYRELTDEERLYWQRFVDKGAERFIRDVAEGRGLPLRDVMIMADGRAFSGEDAVYLKLVDGVGNFYTAVDKAQELADISEATLVYMDYESSLISYLIGYDADGLKTVTDNIAAAGKNDVIEILYAL